MIDLTPPKTSLEQMIELWEGIAKLHAEQSTTEQFLDGRSKESALCIAAAGVWHTMRHYNKKLNAE